MSCRDRFGAFDAFGGFDPEVVKVATQGIKRVDIECIPTPISNGPINHQTRSFQHANMLGNSRSADRERAGDPANRLRTIYESPQDVSTNRHSKCGQLIGVSHVLWSIAFHVYIPRIASVSPLLQLERFAAFEERFQRGQHQRPPLGGAFVGRRFRRELVVNDPELRRVRPGVRQFVGDPRLGIV